MRFEKIRKSLARRRLKKMTTSEQVYQPADWDGIRHVALLADGNDPMSYEKVLEYISELKKDGKTVHALLFMDLKKNMPVPVTPVGVEIITYQHLAFDLTPVKETIRDFIKEPFDILIYLNIEENLPLEIIFRQSKARFKTGMETPYTSGLHFAIAIDQRKEKRDKLWSLAENLKLYLKQIHY